MNSALLFDEISHLEKNGQLKFEKWNSQMSPARCLEAMMHGKAYNRWTVAGHFLLHRTAHLTSAVVFQFSWFSQTAPRTVGTVRVSLGVRHVRSQYVEGSYWSHLGASCQLKVLEGATSSKRVLAMENSILVADVYKSVSVLAFWLMLGVDQCLLKEVTVRPWKTDPQMTFAPSQMKRRAGNCRRA